MSVARPTFSELKIILTLLRNHFYLAFYHQQESDAIGRRYGIKVERRPIPEEELETF